MRRIALVCPGRGTYTRGELGSLTRAGSPVREDLLARADRWRRSIGRRTVSELDRLERFGAVHLAGENAAALIYTASAADLASLAPELEVVAVCGNSMGWYTALHAAGVLGFEDGLRLADTMGGFQAEGVVGGQVIVPVVDEEWRPDPFAREAVEDALATARRSGFRAWPSIHLGGFAVLAGDQEAVRLLLKTLPRSRTGQRDYPFQLLGHSAFHTPLMEETARKGREQLHDLPWGPPRVPLVDGRGRIFHPCTTRGQALLDYTLGTQVTTPYDFTASVRVLLRELAPEALVLPGPGDSLGGAIGQVLAMEGWSGIRSRSDFAARQQTDHPILCAMARPDQHARVAAS